MIIVTPQYTLRAIGRAKYERWANALWWLIPEDDRGAVLTAVPHVYLRKEYAERLVSWWNHWIDAEAPEVGMGIPRTEDGTDGVLKGWAEITVGADNVSVDIDEYLKWAGDDGVGYAESMDTFQDAVRDFLKYLVKEAVAKIFRVFGRRDGRELKYACFFVWYMKHERGVMVELSSVRQVSMAYTKYAAWKKDGGETRLWRKQVSVMVRAYQENLYTVWMLQHAVEDERASRATDENEDEPFILF